MSGLKSTSRKLFEGNLFGLPKRSLEQGLLQQRPFVLEMANGAVPLSFKRGTSSTLIVNFHGAVNKSVRTPPVFSPHVRFASPTPHQLSISDPTMLLPGEFGVAWYAGHEGFDTQAAVLEIVRECARMLKAARIIFLGGSAGGYAALYSSWHFPDSYAVVAAPQTNLDRYSLSRKAPYRKAAWPGLPPKVSLSNVTCANLCKLYDAPMPNNVVMIYSAGDRVHFSNHLLPFAATMARHPTDRFVVECGYWGVEGHSGAVPPFLLNDWLQAIMRHPDKQAADLLAAVHGLRLAREGANGQGGKQEAPGVRPGIATLPSLSPKAACSFEQKDVEMADRLASLLIDEN